MPRSRGGGAGSANPLAKSPKDGGFKVPKLPEVKKKPRGAAAQAKAMNGTTCGAKKKHGGGRCSMAAGWGTDHPGIGRCRRHGGSTPTHTVSAATGEMRKLLGNPIDINPLDALLWCIRIRAGEVQWLTDQIGFLKDADWTQHTIAGKQFHLYVRERQAAMQDLARFSQMAISLGIAERAVKLSEMYGQLLAQLVQGILADLDLSDEQRAMAPSVIRKWFLKVDSGSIQITDDRKSLPMADVA